MTITVSAVRQPALLLALCSIISMRCVYGYLLQCSSMAHNITPFYSNALGKLRATKRENEAATKAAKKSLRNQDSVNTTLSAQILRNLA